MGAESMLPTPRVNEMAPYRVIAAAVSSSLASTRVSLCKNVQRGRARVDVPDASRMIPKYREDHPPALNPKLARKRKGLSRRGLWQEKYRTTHHKANMTSARIPVAPAPPQIPKTLTLPASSYEKRHCEHRAKKARRDGLTMTAPMR